MLRPGMAIEGVGNVRGSGSQSLRLIRRSSFTSCISVKSAPMKRGRDALVPFVFLSKNLFEPVRLTVSGRPIHKLAFAHERMDFAIALAYEHHPVSILGPASGVRLCDTVSRMTPDPEAEIDKEDRRLCSDCVGELFLRAEIAKRGRVAVCSYCGHEGKTFSIAEVADAVEHAFEEHFYRTSTEPSGMEYAMIKEGDYDRKREGDPVVDVIGQYAEIEPESAEDIRQVLEERHFDRERDEMGEEGPFDEETRYAERDVDDADSQAGWFHFERTLKSQARYFSRYAEPNVAVDLRRRRGAPRTVVRSLSKQGRARTSPHSTVLEYFNRPRS
jgi:hypothetical protein